MDTNLEREMRRFLMAAAAILTLSTAVVAQEMRDFTDDLGRTVSIPAEPQRIVSVREEQFTAPLWELGANLVGSAGLIDEGKNNGKPYPRGAYDLFHLTFDNSGLTWIGSPNEPDFEAIAALEPDLILAPSWQEDLIEKYSVIAPTVIFDPTKERALTRYERIADVAGKLDVFNAKLAGYQSRVEVYHGVVADTIGDPATVSVVVAQAVSEDGGIAITNNNEALGQVLHDLGFGAPQVALDLGLGNTVISGELVESIQADFMIGTYNVAWGQTPSAQNAEWDKMAPGWKDLLHAARNNQHFYIDREPMRALSFRALEETMSIIAANIASRDFVPLVQ